MHKEEQQIKYVGEMAGELAVMARQAGNDLIAFLLEMVSVESGCRRTSAGEAASCADKRILS